MSVLSVNNTDFSSLAKTGATSQASSTQATNKKTNELGKEAFLNLLVTQLKNQNPLEPMKDTDFIAQLAQFSSLEQISTMNGTLSSLSGQQTAMNAAAMIGKEVTTLDGTKGVVGKVGFDSGSVSLYVGDKKISMSDITAINNPQA